MSPPLITREMMQIKGGQQNSMTGTSHNFDAPLIFARSEIVLLKNFQHFQSPPDVRCSISSKKAVFNRVIKGGPALQKCYAKCLAGTHVELCSVRFIQIFQRYRLQSENLAAIWVITNQVLKRLKQR